MAKSKSDLSKAITRCFSKGMNETAAVEKCFQKFPDLSIDKVAKAVSRYYEKHEDDSNLDEIETEEKVKAKVKIKKAGTSSKSEKPKKLPKRICYGFPEMATEGYDWLSSMFNCCIYVKIGKRYSPDGFMAFFSIEQAFQWLKSDDKKREIIANCVKAKDARYHGSEKAGAVMRKDWYDIREDVMFELLLGKYTQNLVLRKKLVEIVDIPLFEVAPWDKEAFWGVSKELKGSNKQAKLTQKIAKKLAKDSSFDFNVF